MHASAAALLKLCTAGTEDPRERPALVSVTGGASVAAAAAVCRNSLSRSGIPQLSREPTQLKKQGKQTSSVLLLVCSGAR